MSMADMLYWEREMRATGQSIPDPEKKGWLLPRSEYIKRYGREALADYFMNHPEWSRKKRLEMAYAVMLEDE